MRSRGLVGGGGVEMQPSGALHLDPAECLASALNKIPSFVMKAGLQLAAKVVETLSSFSTFLIAS